MMLSQRVGRKLHNIVRAETLPKILFKVIEAAERENWTADLVRGAFEANPANPQLLDFFDRNPAYDPRIPEKDRIAGTLKETRELPIFEQEKAPPEALTQTKAVVFDFDGTLTHPADYTTTWEKIWVALGYPKERCFELHKRYQRNEFSHAEWCRTTLDAFKAAKLRREQVVKIAKEIPLIEGVTETIHDLRSKGLKLFILSGSIKFIIREVLGDVYKEFEEIKANELLFDSSGDIAKIEGTPYDFEGKALFIKRIIQDYDLSPSDVLFVGNDCNDIFASQSGARTLCVNARFTDPANQEHWTYAIRDMQNLGQILKFVQL